MDSTETGHISLELYVVQGAQRLSKNATFKPNTFVYHFPTQTQKQEKNGIRIKSGKQHQTQQQQQQSSTGAFIS